MQRSPIAGSSNTPDARWRVLVRCSVVLAAFGLCACSSAKMNPIPPPIAGRVVDSPVGCNELGNGQITGKEIHLDGGIPNCGADGLRCPLPGISAPADLCGTKNVVALCEKQYWVLRCEAPADASAPADTGADAHLNDATPDVSEAATDAATD